MDGLTPTTFIFLWVEVLKTNIEKPSSSHNQDLQVLLNSNFFCFQSLVYITFDIFYFFKNQID